VPTDDPQALSPAVRDTVRCIVTWPHATPGEAVCRALRSDAARGLSEAEADSRLAHGGPNKLPDQPRPSRFVLLGRQFANAMVVLLVAAAVVSLAVGELLDAAIIAAIVALNALLGYVQEGRAEEAARAVRKLLAPRASVVRAGRVRDVPAERLVPGDVVLVRAGDRVPADGRLLLARRLDADESALTGESQPLAKRAEPPAPEAALLPERTTMMFAGTTVTRGTGRLVVTATGLETEIGHVVSAAAAVKRGRTPLQRRLDRLAVVLLRAAGLICVGLAAVALAQGESLAESFLIGVSLAVAAVPEGLPAVVTVALALGVRRMARHGAIVRRLHAVETLGSTTVICSDKTGTLTENRMEVVCARRLPSAAQPTVERADPSGSEVLREVVAAALLASDHDAHAAAGESTRIFEPTEAAIVRAAQEHGLSRSQLLGGGRVVSVEPFDSERKRMHVVVESPTGRRASYVKGAPEALVPRLAHGSAANVVERAAAEWADRGMRVLLVAMRPGMGEGDDPEAELEAVGLLGLADPPRPTARASVEAARRAGIRTVMITGDHPGTAIAVARAAALVPSETRPELLTGSELESLSDDELTDRVRTTDVYARVVPEHKLRIVEALRAGGEIVAMTGDGVNDAPALRAAHIGIAMGQRGTDAAVAASDMVLADDNYSTIIGAVRAGRTIYDNVLRFVLFLLSANAGEIVVFAAAITAGMGAPLTVIQILTVNLFTDGLPAVALAVDPPAAGVMRRPPRPPAQGIIEPIRSRLLVGGAAMGLAGFGSFLVGRADGEHVAQTMTFTTLVFAQLAYVFAIRGSDWFFRAGNNRSLNAAVIATASVMTVVLAVPALAARFDVVGLDVAQLAVALALALVPLTALEIFKVRRRRRPD
jgi:Ca2+-transporting ATPase